MKNKPCQTGMTLIEIMIALLIGAFLLGGVLQIFVSSKQTYRMQEGLSRLQENSRYALEMLNKDLRLSGYQGCKSISELTPTNSAGGALPIIAPIPAAIIIGYNGSPASPPNNTWSPALPATLSGLPNPAITSGTDVITILYGESCGGYLSSDMANATADVQIFASNTCAVSANDLLLISDCSTADLFRADANSTTTTIKHTTSTLPNACAAPPCYKTTAEVFAYREYSYFIRTGASGEPSLWRLDNTKATGGNNPVEMIEGIENLQILYGVDTDADGTANYYETANNVNMSNVVSIRFTLLARTSDNLAAQTLNYDYNGSTGINPGDQRIRRVFTTTIAVRNRL